MENEKKTLDQTHPELCKQWHPSKNGYLTPSQVTAGSNKKVWWLYPYDDPLTGHHDFEWETTVYHRAMNGSGCPFLSQRAWPGFNDLKTLRPDLAVEWNYKKNGNQKPEHFTISSHKEVWWILPYKDPETGKTFIFEWPAKINNRALLGAGCPYLRGWYAFPGFNDLASKRPDLAAQWNYEKNSGLKPEQVTVGTKKKVWWLLPYDDPNTGKHFDFEWVAAICDRNNGDGCPFTANRAVWKGFNDLCTTHPEIAKTWNYEKNGALKPEDFTASSKKKVWWKVEYFDDKTKKMYVLEWDAKIYLRIKTPNNPNFCNRLYPEFNDLATRFPDIAAEWNYEKNGELKPENFTYGSKKKVWWTVEYEGKKYEWQMKINARTSQGQGCPDLKLSKLEKVIAEVLKQHKIIFKREKSLKELKDFDKERCRYDFYLKSSNLIIECDGIQHFQAVKAFGGNDSFEIRKENDNLKNECAFSNNIPILRIPYTYDPTKNKEKIESLILDFIKTKIIPQEIIGFYSKFKFSNYAECVKNYHDLIKD